MERHPSSFRDDAGYLFRHEGVLYRAVTAAGRDEYKAFISSGLYGDLVSSGQLIPHEEVAAPVAGLPLAVPPLAVPSLAGLPVAGLPDVALVLKPEPVPFVSYPYEWCFSQLKDAALLTLAIQRKALEKGLCLKDASFFNVQFLGARPIFIDTLSFEPRRDEPWVAYRQFCQHFLGPLALMARTFPTAHRQLATHVDGLPLAEVCRLLPARSRLRFGLFLHLFAHAAAQRRYESRASGPGRDEPRAAATDGSRSGLSRFGLRRQLALVDSLEGTVSSLKPPRARSEWSDYEKEASHYSGEAETFKKAFVDRAAGAIGSGMVWDLGGNVGVYSRIAAARGARAICFDGDHACVEINYGRARAGEGPPILPLLLDLANPTPAAGWGHRERMSLAERGPADLLLALALVHHLRITCNVPFREMFAYFADLGRRAVVEFVPKDDPMARRLMRSREDIFHDFTRPGFEEALGERFRIEEARAVPGGGRVLYALERR